MLCSKSACLKLQKPASSFRGERASRGVSAQTWTNETTPGFSSIENISFRFDGVTKATVNSMDTQKILDLTDRLAKELQC